MLKQKIESDLKESLKNKDMVRAGALRMLKTAIKNQEISKQKEATDEDIISLAGSEIKRRKDSAEAYIKGNRPELADKEQFEIDVLRQYMPEQLSEQQIESIIDEVISGKNFGPADFGKAMGLLMPKVKSQADGSVVSRLLKQKLQN